MNPVDQIAAEAAVLLLEMWRKAMDEQRYVATDKMEATIKSAIEEAVVYHVENNTDFIKGVRESLRSRAAQASEDEDIPYRAAWVKERLQIKCRNCGSSWFIEPFAAQASEQSVIAPTKEFMEAQSPQSDDTKRLIEALIFIRDNANHGVLKAVATDTLKSIGIDSAMSQTKEKE